jgi:hypothetical protein
LLLYPLYTTKVSADPTSSIVETSSVKNSSRPNSSQRSTVHRIQLDADQQDAVPGDLFGIDQSCDLEHAFLNHLVNTGTHRVLRYGKVAGDLLEGLAAVAQMFDDADVRVVDLHGI